MASIDNDNDCYSNCYSEYSCFTQYDCVCGEGKLAWYHGGDCCTTCAGMHRCYALRETVVLATLHVCEDGEVVIFLDLSTVKTLDPNKEGKGRCTCIADLSDFDLTYADPWN